MSGIDVRPVRDPAGLQDFIKVARRAEAANPQWVEQLHDEARQMFDLKSPFRTDNAVQPLVAYRSGEPIGRIVATVDAAHQLKYRDSCGFFGFVESVDDPASFSALFAAAETFLREHGMSKARGPFGLNINGESGLLVEGFDQVHVTQTNHCPPYYSRRIEELGYSKAIDLYAFTCNVKDSGVPERVEREFERMKAPAIDIRTASYRTFFRDLATLIDFYNEAWADNLWSLPVPREEMAFIGKMMLPVVKPKWIGFASYQGELVAILAQLPDVNEALRGLDGLLFPIGLPKLLWRLHVRGTRRARVILAATAKKWRDTIVGVAALAQLMAKSIRDAREAGVEEVEYSWILETNQAAIAPVIRLPARRTRVFRIYEKELSSNASEHKAQGLEGEEQRRERLGAERPLEPHEATSAANLTGDALRADIAKVLKEALVRRTGRAASEWSEETRLKDAGLDSFDALECLFELEERYKIDIDFNVNDPEAKLVTVGDFVDLVSRAVNARRKL